METLFSAHFETPIGSLRAVASEQGLVYVELPHANGRGFAGWKKTHAPEAGIVDAVDGKRRVSACAPLARAIEQLKEYASGERRVFELDLDLRATPFQKAVYKHVAKIGYGETLSYSDVARAISRPRAVRAVGAANGANPIPLVIPCHRVIARGGALQGYAGGLDLKARLLAMESALPEAVAEQVRLF